MNGVYYRLECGWICWPHFRVPGFHRLRDKDATLCPVQLVVGSAVVVPEPFEALFSDGHCSLAVQRRAEEPHRVLFHFLYHRFLNSMICKLHDRRAYIYIYISDLLRSSI
jgi:hypothetical protein